MKVFKWIWRYINDYKSQMSGGMLLVLVCAVASLVNPYLAGKIVDDVITNGKTDLLIPIIGIMIGATLFKSLGRYGYKMIFESVSQNVIFKIRDDIYARLQKLDFDFFDKTKTGDIMARMTGDINVVRHFVGFVIHMIFENSVIFISAIIMMLAINVQFTLILLAITPITGWIAYKLANDVKPTFMAIREQFSKLNSVVQENISGNRVVKAFTQEDYEIQKFSEENEGFKQKNLESSKIWAKYLPILEIMSGILTLFMILIGGIMVSRGVLTYGELVVFNSIIWALNNPMRMAGWLINDVQRFSAAGEKITALMETNPKIKNEKNVVNAERIKGNIEFKNVCFSYGDESVLEDISFKAKVGQTIAIIGPTGSGKSTLVNLICRFYDCTKGEVLIDGYDVKDMNIRKLRESISVAMQDIFLFSDTIEGNIAYGVPDASVQQIKKVASIADAHNFISGFPEGYDTIVGERGVGLSGGQKQRIALARALLKNPSVLILDDTTSSVDMETEHAIHKSLKSYYKDRTTFIIAHRISAVKSADHILVLDKGRIIEQGTHKELLKKKGEYYNVFMNQFGDFDHIYTEEVG